MKRFKILCSDVFDPDATAAATDPQRFMTMERNRATKLSMWRTTLAMATSALRRAASQKQRSKRIRREWTAPQRSSKYFQTMV